MAFIEGWPHLRGGLYEGFHCILGEDRGRPSLGTRLVLSMVSYLVELYNNR